METYNSSSTLLLYLAYMVFFRREKRIDSFFSRPFFRLEKKEPAKESVLFSKEPDKRTRKRTGFGSPPLKSKNGYNRTTIITFSLSKADYRIRKRGGQGWQPGPKRATRHCRVRTGTVAGRNPGLTRQSTYCSKQLNKVAIKY